ncbi:uncharacterized protein CCOS01_15285, partial [Colletotrichum costaricense]
VFLTSLLPTGLRRSIDAYCTDDGSRRLGGVSRDMDVVNAAHIEWARFL